MNKKRMISFAGISMTILTLLLSAYHPEPVAGVKPDKTAHRGAENVGIIGNTAFVEAVGTQCGWTVESDGTVKLTPGNLEKIRAVTKLNIGNQGLTDLSGIEWFTALTDLACNNNQLTTLDVSKNTVLTDLDCDGNRLTELDVSKNTVLRNLSCQYNRLTSLDVPDGAALTGLYCHSNRLTELDVSANTALTYLVCFDNRLTELDLSTNTALRILECGSQTSGNLALILNEGQKTTWENEWKIAYTNNNNVVLAE